MSAWLQTMHCLAGVIVVAEALNKLERTTPCARGLTPRQRVLAWLKAVAWVLMTLGGAGAIVTPLLSLETPTLQDVAVIVGFAVLIVRSRLKESLP